MDLAYLETWMQLFGSCIVVGGAGVFLGFLLDDLVLGPDWLPDPLILIGAVIAAIGVVGLILTWIWSL